MRKISYLLAISLLTSCTIIRGYMADGAYGPTSFSYEKQLKDTVVNRSEVLAHLQSSVFKLSKDLIDSIHEEGIVAYTS